jgi:hypothetical protein
VQDVVKGQLPAAPNRDQIKESADAATAHLKNIRIMSILNLT